MDILDDFPKEAQTMESKRATELYELMKSLQANMITLNNYYRRLAVFWEEEGFPEWANEAKAKIRD
tara:strand:- start:2526 stop:2723 length:198 start_codon:yes stop_codon:yes gene_type:complete